MSKEKKEKDGKERKDEKKMDDKSEADRIISSLAAEFNQLKAYMVNNHNNNNNHRLQNKISCYNCRADDHVARECTQPCKICKGDKGTHSFFNCPSYKPRDERLDGKKPEAAMLVR